MTFRLRLALAALSLVFVRSAAAQSTFEPGQTVPIRGIEFVRGSATLTPSAELAVRELAATLTALPEVRLTIRAALVGTAPAAQKAALARATAIKASLVAAGVPAGRLTTEAGAAPTSIVAVNTATPGAPVTVRGAVTAEVRPGWSLLWSPLTAGARVALPLSVRTGPQGSVSLAAGVADLLVGPNSELGVGSDSLLVRLGSVDFAASRPLAARLFDGRRTTVGIPSGAVGFVTADGHAAAYAGTLTMTDPGFGVEIEIPTGSGSRSSAIGPSILELPRVPTFQPLSDTLSGERSPVPVTFRWRGGRARIELAADDAFAAPTVAALADSAATVNLPFGSYTYRLRGVSSNGLILGPSSPVARFTLQQRVRPTRLALSTLPATGETDNVVFVRDVTLLGETEPDAIVTMAGLLIQLDRQGRFSRPLRLKPGRNVFTLQVRRPVGPPISRDLSITYQPYRRNRLTVGVAYALPTPLIDAYSLAPMAKFGAQRLYGPRRWVDISFRLGQLFPRSSTSILKTPVATLDLTAFQTAHARFAPDTQFFYGAGLGIFFWRAAAGGQRLTKGYQFGTGNGSLVAVGGGRFRLGRITLGTSLSGRYVFAGNLGNDLKNKGQFLLGLDTDIQLASF